MQGYSAFLNTYTDTHKSRLESYLNDSLATSPQTIHLKIYQLTLPKKCLVLCEVLTIA